MASCWGHGGDGVRACTWHPGFTLSHTCVSVCRFFLSNLKLKIATALEMMTILCPEYFLVMGSCANCLKVRSRSFHTLLV